MRCIQTFATRIDKIQAGLDKQEETDFPLIYRALCDPEQYKKGKRMPTRASLLEESIALVSPQAKPFAFHWRDLSDTLKQILITSLGDRGYRHHGRNNDDGNLSAVQAS